MSARAIIAYENSHILGLSLGLSLDVVHGLIHALVIISVRRESKNGCGRQERRMEIRSSQFSIPVIVLSVWYASEKMRASISCRVSWLLLRDLLYGVRFGQNIRIHILCPVRTGMMLTHYNLWNRESACSVIVLHPPAQYAL